MSLDLIRDASKEQLRDRKWLEQTIRDVGVYPAKEIPQHIWRYPGFGICQFPNQFAPYLIHLSKLKITSYAEIGIWVGGTLAFTTEYLRRFGLKKSLGLDIELKDEVKAYAETNPDLMLVEASSTSPEAAKALRKFKPDLILVDGDHTEEGARADWELASSIAPHVAIHDIVGSGYPGVGRVWEEIEGEKLEWIDQYGGGPRHNGMGLVKCVTA